MDFFGCRQAAGYPQTEFSFMLWKFSQLGNPCPFYCEKSGKMEKKIFSKDFNTEKFQVLEQNSKIFIKIIWDSSMVIGYLFSVN